MILGAPAKTSKVNDVDIVMNNSTLEKVNSFKYLGVTIDCKLEM